MRERRRGAAAGLGATRLGAAWLVGACLVASPAVAADVSLAAADAGQRPCVIDHAGASRAVTDTYDELRKIYTTRLPGPRGGGLIDKKVNRLVAQRIDVALFTAEVLERIWERGSAAQREAWTAAMEAMLRRRYLRSMDEPQRERVTIERSEASCGRATVAVALTSAGGSGRHVVLALAHGGQDGWRVYNVTLDGVSLVRTWRSRFRRIHSEGGLAGVDEQMTLLYRRYDGDRPESSALHVPDPRP